MKDYVFYKSEVGKQVRSKIALAMDGIPVLPDFSDLTTRELIQLIPFTVSALRGSSCVLVKENEGYPTPYYVADQLIKTIESREMYEEIIEQEGLGVYKRGLEYYTNTVWQLHDRGVEISYSMLDDQHILDLSNCFQETLKLATLNDHLRYFESIRVFVKNITIKGLTEERIRELSRYQTNGEKYMLATLESEIHVLQRRNAGNFEGLLNSVQTYK